jgi:hypothetical protein
MITAFARNGLIFAAASAFLGLMMLSSLAQTKKLGDGLTFEGAGASFIGSGQTTTLDCAVAFGDGANIEFAGSNNAITWTSPDGKEPVVRHVGSGNTLTVGH